MATVQGNKPFFSTTKSFTVGKTTGGYTLAYGVNKDDLTAYPDPVPANEDLVVNGVTPHTWFMLSGCTDESVIVVFNS